MKNTDKLVEFLHSNNPFKQLYDEGATPEGIKDRIVSTLKPFFNNRNSLEKIAINLIVPDYINLNRLRGKYSRIDEDIKIVLATYYDSISINSDLLYETISELIPEDIEAGNNFWTFVNLERDKSKLAFYEFVKESFENIGDIIEGLMKIFIIENIAVNRIVRKKQVDISKIKSTKLGILFEELIQTSNYPHLFTTQPDGIKFSVWRNIAAHKSYKIQSDLVLCQFDVSPNVKSISLSKPELFDRVNQIVRSLEVLNLSHKLFLFDNSDKFRPNRNKNHRETSCRDEIWLLFFITGVCSQGFEVINFDYETNGKALMIVKDLTERDPKLRGIHTSQFIYPIWLGTRARDISVEYKLRNGKLYLKSNSNNKVCEKIYQELKPFEYLAEEVIYQFV